MVDMSVIEAGWLMLDKPNSPMHISSLMIFKKAKDYDVMKYLRQHKDTYKPAAPFNYVLKKTLRKPFGEWRQEETFAFDYHVTGIALSPEENSPDHLYKTTAWLHSIPLDRNRPLWQLFIIQGLPENHYALLIKVHHSLMDGAFAMSLLDKMLQRTAAHRDDRPFWTQNFKAMDQKSKSARLPFNWKGKAHKTMQFLESMGQLTLRALNHRLPMTLPYSAPPCLINTEISSRRNLEVAKFSLAEIHKLADFHKVTINDVLLYLTGSALQSYLRSKDQNPKSSLKAIMPVSLRKQGEDALGCRLGFALTELGSGDARPAERLACIKRTMQAAKVFLQSFDATQKIALTSALDLLFVGSHLWPGLSKSLPQIANVLISNVVGPKSTLYFNGDRLEQIIPLSLLFDGQALNVTALSYKDHFTISCVSCPDVLFDPELLQLGFREAYEELQALAHRPKKSPKFLKTQGSQRHKAKRKVARAEVPGSEIAQSSFS